MVKLCNIFFLGKLRRGQIADSLPGLATFNAFHVAVAPRLSISMQSFVTCNMMQGREREGKLTWNQTGIRWMDMMQERS